MSFAGKVTRGRSIGRVRGTTAISSGEAPGSRSMTVASEDSAIDWQQVAIFATGLAIGAVVGVGTALLLAPKSGRDTRRAIIRGSRHLRSRGHDAWDDLRDELREAARRSRRSLRGVLRRHERQAERQAEEAEMSA